MLILTAPSGDPERVVAGLPLALRLALDAEAGGVEAVVLSPETERLRPILADERLQLPIISERPEDVRAIVCPANLLVHRGLFSSITGAAQAGVSGERDVFPADQHLQPDVPFSFPPIEVVDASTARQASENAFRALRKPQDGWTARWLNRYISLFLSRLLVRTPLTPNQVSIGILAIGLWGAWLASRGDYPSVVLGAFLFQMQSVLDGCDGEMSRITYRGSLKGQWLDTVGDDVTNYSFYFGAAWGLAKATGFQPYLYAGIVVVLCGVIASGLEYRYLIRIGSGDLLKYPLSAGEGQSRFMAAIQPLFKRDTFVFLTFLAATVGLLGPMLVVFSAGAVGVLLSVIKTELRLARERREKAPAP